MKNAKRELKKMEAQEKKLYRLKTILMFINTKIVLQIGVEEMKKEQIII